MPTYRYRCEACEREFSIFHAMLAPVRRKCPECKKMKLVRLIGSGSGIIFKGSGFYETDYKRKPEEKPKPSNPKKSDGRSTSA